MYPVSAAYKAALQSIEQFGRLRGTVGTVPFTEDNVVEGSFSVTNQCSDNEEIRIGQVYVGELKATFRGLDISRYSWRGLEIRAAEGLRLADRSFEDVPLGVYDISEAEWGAAGISVTAYDHMARFDKAYPGQQQMTGVAYELTMFACEQCGVELGMTEEQVTALPNGTEFLSVYSENDIETWRDFVSWLAQTLGSFATMDRDGKLVYRAYGGEPIDTIDDYHRFSGASFSDFVTRYTGLSVVNATDQTTTYYSADPDDGLTYNAGNNPFLQYGTKDMYDNCRKAVLAALQRIDYMPFKVSAIGSPAYDLGDVIVFAGGLADGTKRSCITKFTYRYNGKYEMQGVGKNPALASARSKVDKQLQGIRNSVTSESIVFYRFTNAATINIASDEKKTIAEIRYTSLDQRTAIFQLEALIDVASVDAGIVVAQVNYILNDTVIADYHPTETWIDGMHILHLMYYLEISSTVMQHLKVELETHGGSVRIEQGKVQCSVYGQGLAATDKWDGTLDITDTIADVVVSAADRVRVCTVIDSPEITIQVPVSIGISEAIPNIALAVPAAVAVDAIRDQVAITGLEEE